MSEYFNIRCDTCGVELDDSRGPECWRNGRDLVLTLIEDAPELVTAWATTQRRYEVRAWWGAVPMGWLELHHGHVLRPISEYEPRAPGIKVD